MFVTIESLKDALTKFRKRGDERWAMASAAVTEAVVRAIVGEEVGGLTESEVEEVLDVL